MPFEIFVIIIVAIVGGVLSGIVKQVLGYMESKAQRAAPADSSLTASELEGLVRAAVEDATQPLLERIDTLERRLPASTQKQLQGETEQTQEGAASLSKSGK